MTPTASKELLEGFGGVENPENWLEGIYVFPQHWRGAIAVIHQLPKIPETLWLRILGKGKVQERAIGELSALATDDPLRMIALELLYRLQSHLAVENQQEPESEERELMMAIRYAMATPHAPLFQQQLQAAEQQAREEGLERGLEPGLEQGRQAQQRLI